MKVSLIATLRNEEATIGALLASLQAQTRQPDEIVFTDGGSTDRTVEIIRSFPYRGAAIQVLSIPGANISQGRNAAIRAATGEVVATTDAGVRLVPEWLEELCRPFGASDRDSARPDVVSGFFVPDPHNPFEAAMGATVLPQLDDVQPDSFLPSSRSVAFTKEAWQRVGGYPEWLDYCEDLVFDFALKKAGCHFAFAPTAIAYFRPRSSLGAFFRQYYRYARGDGKADLWRKRHATRYATYLSAPLALVAGVRYPVLWLLLAAAALAYCWRPYQRLWPALRSYGPADRLKAIALVPVIRFVGDVAKMAGYPVGVWWRLRWARPKAVGNCTYGGAKPPCGG